jgi:hypothetical protein
MPCIERLNHKTILRSVLASRLLPLLAWSVILTLLFCHTGTFRIKPKENRHKPAQLQDSSAQLKSSPLVIVWAPWPSGVIATATRTPAVNPSLFLTLLEKAAQLPALQASAKPNESLQEQPLDKPRMAFVSVRADDYSQTLDEEGTGAMIPCRLDGAISNSKDGSKIIIHALVVENIAAISGRILIQAGTRALGIGRVDSLTGRIRSYGKWTLVTDNHALRALARLVEYASGRDGLRGQETSPEPPELQKQAIKRDGIYLYVPDGQYFALQLLGQFQLQDLRPAQGDD